MNLTQIPDFTAIFGTFQIRFVASYAPNKTPWTKLNFQVGYDHWNW